MAATGRECGSCGICCKIVVVPEVDKPRGVWCRHYTAEKGCGIYETRPAACRKFLCTWLTHPEFGEEWKPNIAGFFMWEQPVPNGRRLILEVDADRPFDWQREPYLSTLQWLATRAPDRKQVEVMVRTSGNIQMLFPEGLIDLGPQRDWAVASGYVETEQGIVPYAYYVDPADQPAT